MRRRRFAARGQVDATAVPAPTEIPADAQAPRPYGAGMYYGGESDIRKEGANWLRALMGQSAAQMEPTGALPEATLRAAEEVDVTAPYDATRRVPPHLDHLYLGTATEPPAATYTPPPGSPPKIDAHPELQAAWAAVMERHPYAARGLQSVSVDDRLGDRGVGGVYDNGRIRVDGHYGTDRGTLAHELTHAAQERQFTKPSPAWRAYAGKPWTPYAERPGEQLAQMVERATYGELPPQPHYLARLQAWLAQNPDYPR